MEGYRPQVRFVPLRSAPHTACDSLPLRLAHPTPAIFFHSAPRAPTDPARPAPAFRFRRSVRRLRWSGSRASLSARPPIPRRSRLLGSLSHAAPFQSAASAAAAAADDFRSSPRPTASCDPAPPLPNRFSISSLLPTPPPLLRHAAKKKNRHVDLGCVIVKRMVLWWAVWGLVAGFALVGLPVIVSKSIPRKIPRPPPPDQYAKALHKALLFFNAQK